MSGRTLIDQQTSFTTTVTPLNSSQVNVFDAFRGRNSSVVELDNGENSTYSLMLSCSDDFIGDARRWSEIKTIPNVGFELITSLTALIQKYSKIRESTREGDSRIQSDPRDIGDSDEEDEIHRPETESVHVDQYVDADGNYYYLWTISTVDDRTILGHLEQISKGLSDSSLHATNDAINDQTTTNGSDGSNTGTFRGNNNNNGGSGGTAGNSQSRSGKKRGRNTDSKASAMREWVYYYSGIMTGKVASDSEITKECVWKENDTFSASKFKEWFGKDTWKSIIEYKGLTFKSRYPIEWYDRDLFVDQPFPHVDKVEIALVNFARENYLKDPTQCRGPFNLNTGETQYVDKSTIGFVQKYVTDIFDYVSNAKKSEILAFEEAMAEVYSKDDLMVYHKEYASKFEAKFSDFKTIMTLDTPDILMEFYQTSVKNCLRWFKHSKLYQGKRYIFAHISHGKTPTIEYFNWKHSEPDFTPFGYLMKYHAVSSERHYHMKSNELGLHLLLCYGTLSRYNGEPGFKMNLWVYGPAGAGKSRQVSVWKKCCPEGTYIDADVDSSAISSHTETIQGGMVSVTDEGTGALDGTDRSPEARKKEKEFKITTTKQWMGRTNTEWIPDTSRGEDTKKKVSVTYNTKHDNVGVYLSNIVHSRIDDATASRLLPYAVPYTGTVDIVDNIFVDSLKTTGLDYADRRYQSFMKDVHMCVMFSEKAAFAHFTLRPSDSIAYIACTNILKALQARGINDPHIRFVNVLVTMARSYCIASSWVEMHCMTDSRHRRKAFTMELVYEASRYHVIKIEHIAAALGTIFDAFLDQKYEWLMNHLGTKRLPILDEITQTNKKIQSVRLSRGERPNVTYFEEPARLNYDYHLFVLAEVFKNRSKNKIGFGRIPSIQGSPPMLDLNYVVFKSNSLKTFADSVTKQNQSCLYKAKDIVDILLNAEEKVKIRPKKVLQYVEEQKFQTSILSWIDAMTNGHVNSSHIKGDDSRAICVHDACTSVFKDISRNNLPINPSAPDMSYDCKSVPAVKIVNGETVEIWIHLDVLYRRHRVDDLIAALGSLNTLCKKSRTLVVPTSEGVKTVVLPGHGKDSTVIDIANVRKNKVASRWLDELESRSDVMLPDLPPKEVCTRTAEYRRQIQTMSKLEFDEDIDDYFANIRLEAYGIWVPRVESSSEVLPSSEIITLGEEIPAIDVPEVED